MSNVTKAQGFTLLELMVAVVLFSLISLSGFTILNTVQKGNAGSLKRTERHNELQRAFLIMERDLTQITKRTIRFNGEAPAEGFIHTQQNNFFGDSEAFAFVRSGWTNPSLLLPRSDLQSVAYQISENILQRVHYNFVDAVVGEEPKLRPLITDVEGITFEFYDGKAWQKKWSGNSLPQAIAIEIDTFDYGIIRRQFLVASGAPSTSGEND